MAGTNLDFLTAIWKTQSPEFKARIPQPSKDNWAAIGIMLNSSEYEAERNQIFNELVNRIVLQKVHQAVLSNPFSRFISGKLNLGEGYEEIMTDVISGMTFTNDETDQFKKFGVDVKNAFHKVNREMVYPITIEEVYINRAFVREGGISQLQNTIMNQMYNANNLDEMLFTKQLIQEYYKQASFPLASGQILEVDDPRENLMDTGRTKAFVMAVKGCMRDMRFPKTVYNPVGFTMQVAPSDMEIIMLSELGVSAEVQTLSQAFQPQYLDVNVPITDIDTFGDGMDDILGVMFDREWLRIFDYLRTLRTSENARSLYRNYFYHVHQLYAASPFKPVVFIKAKQQP